ncbi:MAG: hypothetical protein IPJ38_16615 [Dechloromonas sp.]|uniref:Uncharacterized protein n=1 Tax=Candidatus Dechloromonas phosphorivorans TaxID=2899244 RepID=A0A935K508_9RHOO|nr:hypothetical protein [Candidatus Dechloromonas phosphorivorans]
MLMVQRSSGNLWYKKSGPSEPANTNVKPAHSSEEQTIASLDTRIIELKNEVTALHDQMLASSEIIEALAEQIRS